MGDGRDDDVIVSNRRKQSRLADVNGEGRMLGLAIDGGTQRGSDNRQQKDFIKIS